LAAAIGAAAIARPAPAAAQACCAGGALLTPTRLAVQEDYAVGLQMQARSNVGSFSSAGGFATSPGSSQVLEQDLAASVRLFRRAQVGILLPTIQDHHVSAAGAEGWGGGIGDLALTARYDFLLAADEVHWPGIALLAGATFPTGKSANEAGADATGGGTYNATLGVGLEKVRGHLYTGLDGWVTYRSNPPGPVSESFGLRWTAMGIAGWVFDNEAAVALYATFLDEGSATIINMDGSIEHPSGLRLTTVGAAGVIPLHELWRLQGAAFSDVMFSSFGRNEIGGFGLTLSLVRAFL
jgi:hypothetical protein